LADEKRNRTLLAAIRVLLTILVFNCGVHAQTAFWSQVDTYIGLTPNIDAMLFVAGTPGLNANRPEVIFGPNLDIALWPFLTHLKTISPERSKYLTFRVGYRYVKNLYGHETTQNNGVLELTPRFPLPLKLQLADRNRIDLRGLQTNFSWRYRNRLTLLRSFEVRHFVTTPYGEAEIFYNCETGQWTQYTYQFGAISRLTSRVEVDTWFRRLTTISEPVTTTNAAGVKLILFFHSFDK
jgi:hypothetical protein